MITDQTISEAKRKDLPGLFQSKNISLISTNNGSSFKCLCPFHEDKDPSLNLNLKDGIWLWNCFGCGVGGTTIDFVMRMENIDFKEAVSKLSAVSNQLSVSSAEPSTPMTLEKRICHLDMALKYFEEIFEKNPKGKEYLERRGIYSPEIVKTFRIGYSDGTESEYFHSERKEFQELGFFDRHYHATFSNCVIFPVFNDVGYTTDIYGRRVLNYTKRAVHCYNKGSHVGIFNLQGIKGQREVILTESIIDALSAYKAGFKNVTAIYGTGGFTKAHEEFFKNLDVKEVILAFDNDEAGRKATQTVQEKLSHLTVKVVEIPDGFKDMNQVLLMAKSVGVKKLIEKAKVIESEEEQENIENIIPFEESKPEESGKFIFQNNDLFYITDQIRYEVKNSLRIKDLSSLRFIVTAVKRGSKEESFTDRIDLYLSGTGEALPLPFQRLLIFNPQLLKRIF